MRTCKACKYHDDYTWVCFNADSPKCADITMNEDICDEYVDDTANRSMADSGDIKPCG